MNKYILSYVFKKIFKIFYVFEHWVIFIDVNDKTKNNH